MAPGECGVSAVDDKPSSLALGHHICMAVEGCGESAVDEIPEVVQDHVLDPSILLSSSSTEEVDALTSLNLEASLQTCPVVEDPPLEDTPLEDNCESDPEELETLNLDDYVAKELEDLMAKFSFPSSTLPLRQPSSSLPEHLEYPVEYPEMYEDEMLMAQPGMKYQRSV